MEKISLIAIFLMTSLTVITPHPGTGIVMDSKGNVYYTDLHHVWKISPHGVRSIAVKDVHTHELAIDRNGHLYGEHEWYEGEATDQWRNYAWRLSKKGEFQKTTPEVKGFLDDNLLIRDARGNTYWKKDVGDIDRLMKTSSSGQKTMYSYHEFDDIRWMHYSSYNAHLYVVDHLSIKSVDEQGRVTTVTDCLREPGPSINGAADHHYLYGMWTDQDHNLYVATFGAGKVKRIGPGGDIQTIYCSEEGWSPCGGMMSEDGTMWIMEFSSHNATRVLSIAPNGTLNSYGE